jgi:hypothetical protein
MITTLFKQSALVGLCHLLFLRLDEFLRNSVWTRVSINNHIPDFLTKCRCVLSEKSGQIKLNDSRVDGDSRLLLLTRISDRAIKIWKEKIFCSGSHDFVFKSQYFSNALIDIVMKYGNINFGKRKLSVGIERLGEFRCFQKFITGLGRWNG